MKRKQKEYSEELRRWAVRLAESHSRRYTGRPTVVEFARLRANPGAGAVSH